MRTRRSAGLTVTLMVITLVPAVVMGTNGYFSHGVGMKAKGMGGTTAALPQDALAPGTNHSSA
jgi:long-chain fatty acid transport protein